MPEQTKNHVNLRIHPEPFKSSHLAIPPSLFSPRTPLAQTPHNTIKRYAKPLPTPDSSVPHPLSPLQWLWQCHQCRRTYALGVTRRCLEDGHHFCAGTTTLKTWRKPLKPGKVKRHRACASEFDYQGWKAWGRWRRSGKRKDSIYDVSDSSSVSSCSSGSERMGSEPGRDARGQGNMSARKDCWNLCDYPSECRWGKRFGIHTPVVTEFPVVDRFPPSPPPPPKTGEEILKPENCEEAGKEKKAEKMDFWGALLASATRRKGVPPSSPLVSVEGEVEPGSPKGKDGDVILSTVNPVLPAQPSSPTASSASSSAAGALSGSGPVATLKEIIRKTSRRGAKSPKATESKEQNRLEPVMIRSAPATVFEELELDYQSPDDSEMDFAPLKRVKSRDNGYHSIPDST